MKNLYALCQHRKTKKRGIIDEMILPSGSWEAVSHRTDWNKGTLYNRKLMIKKLNELSAQYHEDIEYYAQWVRAKG